MVNTIGPSDALAALIRQQVAAFRDKMARERGGADARPAAEREAADVAGIAARRIREIPPEAPDRQRRALRIYLESVLLGELGQELIHDPGFARMIDHVQAQFEADPALATAGRAAAEQLLKAAGA